MTPLEALLPEDVRPLVSGAFERAEFGFGEAVVREGDAADAFYVITSGAARVVKAGDNGGEAPLAVLRAGDVFGETALVGGGTRTATVRASGALAVLRLDKAVFDALARAYPAVREWADEQVRRHATADFLRLRSALSGLPADAVARLLAEVEVRRVAAGGPVVAQGDAPGPAFVVRSGRLRVVRDGTTVGLLRAGDVFGERSMLLGEARSADVEALTDAELFVLPPTLAEDDAVRAALEPGLVQHDFRPVTHVPLDFVGLVEAPSDTQPVGGADAGEPAAGETQADDGAHEQPSEELFTQRRSRRFPVVWQLDEMDCGAASLAAVCRRFGRAVPLTAVREAVGTAIDGTSLQGLVAGAERLGLAARGVKASKSRLDELPLPAICHWEGNHWVVLHDVGGASVRVADPGAGPRRMSREEWNEGWSGFCCLLAPTPALADAPEAGSPWSWLRPFVRPYRRVLVLAAVLSLVAAVLQMLIPVAAGVVVDWALEDGEARLLHALAAGMAGLVLLGVGTGLVQRHLLARLAVAFDTDTLDHVTGRLLALPASYFAARRVGDIERRISSMRQIRAYLVQEGVTGLTAGAQALAAITFMIAFSPLLAAVYVATLPLYGLAMTYARRRLRPLLSSLEEAFGLYHSRQIDAIKGIETVKTNGAEDMLRRLMGRQFAAVSGRVFRADRAFMAYDGAVQLIAFLGLAVVVWAGGLLVLDGRLSVGRLVAFNGLVLLTTGPVATVLRLWDELQYATVLLGRLDDVLSQAPEQGHDREGLQPVPTIGGRVTIERLTVRTDGPVPVTILDDVSLDVMPGQTVALVGRSGAGKSTLARCLAGLVVPASGRILYDGVPMETLDHRQLRRRLGFVLQDNHLFDDSIAANIALGEEVDMTRVRWAAGVADAAEFIERLPLGYETRIGETGVRLSGGQAQRVAIARAVYRQPAVLILDEATSSLDTDSERAVKQGIEGLLQGRTAFVIAHRLSTIRDADRIVVLERGRVAEVGTHPELLARRGIYWSLASEQVEA